MTPGGPGSQWRMMKLRRVFETAEEEGLPVEQVAIDRFGSYQAFEDAKEERKLLDEREAQRAGGSSGNRNTDRNEGRRGFMFNEGGTSNRSESFRRPSAPSTPSPSGQGQSILPNRRSDALRLPSQLSQSITNSHSHTPIPSVMTPQRLNATRGLSPSSLNRLQAKVLRAKLMGTPDAEALEKEYTAAAAASSGTSSGEGGTRTRIEIVPTMDGRGRLYDVGHGAKDDAPLLPGNRKKPEKVVCFF